MVVGLDFYEFYKRAFLIIIGHLGEILQLRNNAIKKKKKEKIHREKFLLKLLGERFSEINLRGNIAATRICYFKNAQLLLKQLLMKLSNKVLQFSK